MANIKIHLINRSGQSDKTIEINDGDKAHYIIWDKHLLNKKYSFISKNIQK